MPMEMFYSLTTCIDVQKQAPDHAIEPREMKTSLKL